MNDDLFAALIFLAISATLNVTIGFSWFRAQRRVRRLENRLLDPQPQLDDRREDRIENSIDALSAQVDQLASGQEFLNRVMAERLERLNRPEVTPH